MLARAGAGQPAEGLMGAAASLFGPHCKPGHAVECERAHASLEIPLPVFSPGPGYGRQLGGSAWEGQEYGVKGNRPLISVVPEAQGSLGALVLGNRFLVL